MEREEHSESVEATNFAKGRLKADECRVVVAQVEQGGNHPQGERHGSGLTARMQEEQQQRWLQQQKHSP